MSLEFGEAEFGVLEKQTGTPIKIALRIDVIEIKPNTPQILSESEAIDCLSYLPPAHVTFNEHNCSWQIMDNQPRGLNSTTLLVGDNFITKSDGFYSIRDGEPNKLIANVQIKISKITKFRANKKVDCVLTVNVKSTDENAPFEKDLSVPETQFKEVFDLIRKKIPAAYISFGDNNAKEEFLSRIYRRDVDTAPIEYHSDILGWVEFEGQSPKFYIGENTFYRGMAIEVPLIGNRNFKEIFENGQGFLKIGNGNEVIQILWLVAHIAPSLFWLRKYGVDFRSVIFLKGRTNLFKTTIVLRLANIFAKSRQKASARLSSTKAYTQDFVTYLRDSVVLLDDFSNTVGANNNHVRENAENVIRAVGDGMFAGKMNVTNLAEGRADDVQCVVVMTGEDSLGLSESSLLRLIVLPVIEGTFDPTALNYYTQNQKILQDYFSLLVKFFTQCGYEVFHDCDLLFAKYREFYSSKFSMPRFIDAAAVLSVEIEIIVRFGHYCGVSESDMHYYRANAIRAVESIIANNLADSTQEKVEIRFLRALWQSFNTHKDCLLANNELEYVKNTPNYIGFKEKDKKLIWLRFEDAYSIVERFYKKIGEQFLTKEKTLKEILLRKGISDGKLMPYGQSGNEYLRKSRKPPRKWFLVLREDVVNQLLDENAEVT